MLGFGQIFWELRLQNVDFYFYFILFIILFGYILFYSTIGCMFIIINIINYNKYYYKHFGDLANVAFKIMFSLKNLK